MKTRIVLSTLLTMVLLVSLSVPLAAAQVPATRPNPLPSAQSTPGPVPTAPNPETVLWDQYANYSGTNLAAQDFEPSYDAYDVWCGDDFENLEPWTIGTIVARGGWTGFVDLNNATALHWYICADNGGLPGCVPGDGTEFWTMSLPPTDPQVSLGMYEPEDFILTLDTPIVLPAGGWWIIFQASLEFGLYGQWGTSTTSNPVFGHAAMQINPNGGFGYGSGWFDTGYNQDLMFRLESPGVEEPDIYVDPEFLSETLCVDEIRTVPLNICNDGTAPLDWNLAEVPGPGQSRTVAVPAGPASLDPGTATSGGPYQARPASVVTIQPGYGVTQGPDILLLEADYDTPGASPIEALLQAYGDLGAIDFFDAQVATPTLGDLIPYDVVLTWSNYTYASPAGIGDVLADYVDAGGKVINLMFSLGTHSWAMQGRFMAEGYTAMNGGNILYGQSCLGSYDPDHPIMAGVTNVCETFRLAGTYLTSGSYEVALWADGLLFVAAKDDASVVSIAGYVGDAYLWTGQMPDVVHNAILWLAGPPVDVVPWLSEDPVAGTVPAGDCQVVDVTFDATGMEPGTYEAALAISSNDPDEPVVEVPVTMMVESCENYVFATHVRIIKLPSYPLLLGIVRAATGDGATPVPGAMVDVTWTIPPGPVIPQTRTTNANGLAFPVMLSLWNGTYTLDLVNITAAGYMYNPAMNQEDSASITLP